MTEPKSSFKLEELHDTNKSPAGVSTDGGSQPDQTSQSGEGVSTIFMTTDDIAKIVRPSGSHTPADSFVSRHFPRFKDLEKANLKYLQEKLIRQSLPYDMPELGNTLHQYSRCC